jgi:hypothetical protein
MTAAHVCDECKTVAPLGDAARWWFLRASNEPEVILTAVEKAEYGFCSWSCVLLFAERMTR